LVLYYRSGQSVREIASATASTEEAVRQRLVRARKSLKVKLEEMVGNILTDTIPGDAFTLTVMTALGTAMLTGGMAQAAVAATTGTTAATGGKALGSATIWSVIGPAAAYGWVFAITLWGFWVVTRNTPTLRSRRFRLYSLFWSHQYYFLSSVILVAIWIAALACKPSNEIMFALLWTTLLAMLPLFLLIILVLYWTYYRKLERIVANDLGLPSRYVESYSYPQVEQQFFRTFITNLLLALTILAVFLLSSIYRGEYTHPAFFIITAVIIAITVVVAAVYYPLGRHLLEICRTKQNFLATPPLIEEPLETILFKTGKPQIPTKKAAGMMRWMLYIGLALCGIWYFSFYSWNKNPVALGFCAILVFAVFARFQILFERIRSRKEMAWLTILFHLLLLPLVVLLEFIEFGEFTVLGMSHGDPRNAIHVMNFIVIFMVVLQVPYHLCSLFWAKYEEKKDTTTGRDALICEAIARFDPVTMTADEPEVAAKPFPRHWLWIIGLYAAAIVVMGCLGVLLT